VAEKPWEGSFNKLYVCMYVCMYDITIELLTHERKDYIFPADSLDMEATK